MLPMAKYGIMFYNSLLLMLVPAITLVRLSGDLHDKSIVFHIVPCYLFHELHFNIQPYTVHSYVRNTIRR